LEISIGGFVPTTENIFLGPSFQTLLTLGAKNAYLIKYKFEIYRLFIPIILHAGVIHILLNVLTQLRLGQFEKLWGSRRFGSSYIMAGFGGNLLSCISQPNGISVGASSSIVGVLGTEIAYLLCHWSKMDRIPKRFELFQLSIIIILLIVIGFTPYVDNGAHLGGLITGFFMGLIFFWGSLNSVRNQKWVRIIGTVALALYFVVCSLVLAFVIKPNAPNV